MAGRVPAAGAVVDPAAAARNQLMNVRPVSNGPMFEFIGDIVSKMRSWEQGHIGWRTAARVAEFLMLIGCIFSLVGVVFWTDGAAEYGRQKEAQRRAGLAGDANINAAVDETDALRRQLAQETARANTADWQVLGLTQQRSAANTRADGATRNVTELTARVRTLEEQLKKAGEGNPDAAAEIARLRGELGNAGELLRNGNELAATLNARIHELEAQLTAARAGGNEASRAATAEIARLRGELGATGEQLEAFRAKIKTLEDGLTAARTVGNEASRAATAEITRLTEALATSKAAEQRLRGERDAFGTKVGELDGRLATANDTARRLTEEMGKMVKIGDADARIRGLTEEHTAETTALQEQLGRLRQTMADAEARAKASDKTLTDKLAVARGEMDKLNNSLEGLVKKETLDAAEARIRELTEKLAKMGDPDTAVRDAVLEILVLAGIPEHLARQSVKGERAITAKSNPVQAFSNYWGQVQKDQQKLIEARLNQQAMAVQQTISGANGINSLIDAALAAIKANPALAPDQLNGLKEALGSRFAAVAPVIAKKSDAKAIGT